ncbi:RluA family pseudouridine synthase [Bacillus litorisediminis]|uniref:RluA family pseudouridine synthase n=1 Tax=Bacillus litorisediminis TaxID=2922713 RepID=UPI001FAC06B9|nr:RluA family pseudouridine synthase [Bacillus litorisediminis]
MAPFQLRWIVQKSEEGQMLREFLFAKEISRRTLTAIKFEGGKIEVNGKEVNVRYILKENDLVRIQFPTEIPSESLITKPIPLDIVYEDESVLVINKPAGILTIPSREQPTHAIANGLLHYYQAKQIESAVHIVTRLDRDTSGLLLVAKHRYIHYLLTLQQKEKTVKRKYEALVEGVLEQVNQIIVAPIGRKENSIIERKVTQEGQYAETQISLIKQYQDFAHIAVQLRTGRTHQIRVHLSYIGHPLFGDDLYGGSLKWMKRQALHCVELSFIHPVTGEVKKFHSELPADMKAILDNIKE